MDREMGRNWEWGVGRKRNGEWGGSETGSGGKAKQEMRRGEEVLAFPPLLSIRESGEEMMT